MAIFAHAEENEVEDGLAVIRCQGPLTQFGFGMDNGFSRRILPSNPMHLICWHFQRRKERLIGQQEITFGVVRRDTAFITPKEMD